MRMSLDAYCVKCGQIMNSWLTASGDRLIVEPCENVICDCKADNKFESDEDFDDEE